MQNQAMIDFINSRRSMGNLTLPIPNQQQLEQVIACAMTAPDHKELKPYRFIILTDDGLTKFGEVLKQATLAEGETDDMALNKAQNMPKRAPMIIVCVTNYQHHPKVPEFEQLLSAGAGVQNLLLALQALGFASVWRTGLLANHPVVKKYFQVDDNNLVAGFIYVGTAGATLPPRKPINIPAFIDYYSS